MLIHFVFLSLWLVTSCKKDPEKEGACGFKDPTTELPWLKQEINFYSNVTDLGYAVFSTRYQGERVFWFSTIRGKGLEYYTCEGKLHSIGSPRPTDEESQKFIQLLIKHTTACEYMIWSTPVYRQISPCK